MTKLAWDYDRSASVPSSTAEYRGLILRAEQDQSPENPFESWDGEPPTVAYYDGSISDYSDGDALDPFSGASDGWISRNWRAIAAALGIDPEQEDSDVRQAQKDYGGGLSDIRRERFEEALGEMSPDRYGNASDYFSALEALWKLRGRAALNWTSRGYSQGDYTEGLSVATERWEKETGAPKDSHERQLAHARDLYSAWAWGDVYGYVVEVPDPDGGEAESLDSCWGYYGSDFSESGLEESAIEAADSILNRAARERAEKLKELIRNRVPLALRPALLAEAGKLRDSMS